MGPLSSPRAQGLLFPPLPLTGCSRPQIMSNNMAKIAEARKTVEQLKLEVNIDRMKVRDPAPPVPPPTESRAVTPHSAGGGHCAGAWHSQELKHFTCCREAGVGLNGPTAAAGAYSSARG